jgi:ferredoxin
MRIRLDRSACVGHALCNSIDPELFPLDDGGFSIVEPHDVQPAEEQRAREAAASCPERALLVDDVESNSPSRHAPGDA